MAEPFSFLFLPGKIRKEMPDERQYIGKGRALVFGAFMRFVFVLHEIRSEKSVIADRTSSSAPFGQGGPFGAVGLF